MNGFIQQKLTDRTLEAVQRLVPIAEGAGLSMAEMALAWVLRRPELASAIVGASRPEQVHANAAAAGIELSADTLDRDRRRARRRPGHRSAARPRRLGGDHEALTRT